MFERNRNEENEDIITPEMLEDIEELLSDQYR